MNGVITCIEAQARRGGRRLNVFLDDRYALSLTVELAAPLRVGQRLSEAEFEALCDTDERARALDSALRLLGYRPRSEQEIRERLSSKRYVPTTIDATVERLRQLKLVDDRAFAEFWTEQRRGRSPRGHRLIALELRGKGVQADVVQQVTGESEDESELAYRAGLKKARALATTDERDFRQKLAAYLQRRGFDWETVAGAVRRLRAEVAD